MSQRPEATAPIAPELRALLDKQAIREVIPGGKFPDDPVYALRAAYSGGR